MARVRSILRRLGVTPALRRAHTYLTGRIFDSAVVARFTRRRHMLCLGDSHVAVMRQVRAPALRFRAEPMRGATASGILNPQSKSRAYETFTARLQRAKPWQEVLLHLGEVDCGFLIWHRAGRRGTDVEEQLAATLDSYEAFIREVAARGFKTVYVLSAPLPTITDYPGQWGEIAHLRSEVSASQEERTALTLRFNRDLQERCPRAGALFVDATTAQLDTGTRLIKSEFVRVDGDHHLDTAAYARVIAAALSAAPATRTALDSGAAVGSAVPS